ncbi:MAG: hypothetical protein N2Z85_01695 [Patescibacteria group bacterium]|nr:hypothetical protein [Patescibacteria group bacterium]
MMIIDNKKIFILIFIIIIIFFLILSFQNINQPFIHVSEDTNGQNGIAALNILKYGIKETKFGLYVSWLDGEKKFNDLTSNFYARHPSWFILPTLILYKFFGINEFTTRLGPLILMLLSIILLFFAFKKIFNENIFLTFISLLIFVILPGTIYYSKHLDPSPPVLAGSIITYSLFIFYYFKSSKYNLFLFLFSIIFGIAMGWHYAAMPISLWLFIVLLKLYKNNNKIKLLIFLIPLFTLIGVLIQLYHIYLLNGAYAIYDLLFNAYEGRSGFYLKYLNWWKIIYERSKLNFTPIFIFGFLIGLILWIYDSIKFKNEQNKKNNKINKIIETPKFIFIFPLIIMPIIITIFFQQWSTHPFGVIFYLPAVALLNCYLLYKVYIKNVGIGILLTTIVLIIGLISSISNLNFFYNKFLILDNNDINLLKELKKEINSKELCLGRNQNLYYGGIVGFYLQKEILLSPECLEKKYKNQTKYALILNPSIDEFNKNEFELFQQNNFKFIGCSGFFCLMGK